MGKLWMSPLLVFVSISFLVAQNSNLTSPTVISPKAHQADMRLFDDRGLENLVDRANRQGEAQVVVDRGKPSLPDGAAPTPAKLIATMMCSADAVSVVTIKGAQPSLSHRQTWVFTEYIVRVKEVVKDNAAHPLTVGQDIMIARSGGQIETAAGKRVRLQDLSFPPFRPGQYLLFMRYVPESGQYTTSDPNGAFRVLGPRLQPLISEKVLFELGQKYNLPSLSNTAKVASCGGTVR
jgi:hypothetical protein